MSTTRSALFLPFVLAAQAAIADEVKPLDAAQPTETVVAPQQWASHQHWFCPPNPVDPIAYAKGMKKYMNEMGAKGWEVVSFSQVTVNKGYCYVATYKAPKAK